MTLRKFSFLIACFVLIVSCSSNKGSAFSNHEAPSATVSVRFDLERYFKECLVEGSIAVYDQRNNRWIVSDSMDVHKETLPASTFKIINLLIALEAGVIKDENETLKWKETTDTTLYGNRPDIYRDMTVKDAFKASAVWVFLELAERIGKDRYREYLRKSSYGSGDITAGLDFWNVGSFGVSPVNQVNFLKSVHEGKAPFSRQNVEILKRVMRSEESDGYSISAKTGWTREGGVNTGWWVGYVESEQGVFFFATRLMQDRKFNSPNFGACSKEITKAVLRDLDIIPEEESASS